MTQELTLIMRSPTRNGFQPGTNSYHAFTNQEWFPLGVRKVKPMRAACANEHESIINVMGDAYAQALDSNGIVSTRYLKFSNSTLQNELPPT